MMRLTAAVVGWTMLCAPALSAQSAAPGDFAMIYEVTHRGSAADFEQHLGMYKKWVEAQPNAWPVAVFEVIMGERTGQYVIGSFNHALADWDSPPIPAAANRAQQRTHIAPFISGYRTSLIQNRRDLGREPAAAALSPMYQVISWQIRDGMDVAFEEFMKALKHAFASQGVNAQYTVFQTRQGSNGSQWAVSIPHANFASFGGGGPLEPLMEKQYGKFHSDAMFESLNKAVLSSRSEVFALRRDLSMKLPNP